MLPLTLPISTEINMQNLMHEASISFDSGKLKVIHEDLFPFTIAINNLTVRHLTNYILKLYYQL